jgi:tRNA(Ile2) C34 agmatinyltransferase TiaS
MQPLNNPNITQEWSIFSVLYEVIKETELKKLRFAKCSNCQLLTPYRLKSLGSNELKCKKCGLTIQLVRGDKR